MDEILLSGDGVSLALRCIEEHFGQKGERRKAEEGGRYVVNAWGSVMTVWRHGRRKIIGVRGRRHAYRSFAGIQGCE